MDFYHGARLANASFEKTEVIDEEEDFDDDEEQLSAMEKVMATAKEKIKEPTKGQIPSGVLPSDIMEKIEEVEVPQSLLAQPEQGLLTKREV